MAKKQKLKQKLSSLGGKLITRDVPKSPISESYRTLRTNIDFSRVDEEIKTLVCTSSIPGEGKTTTIGNLAVTFAQQGKNVLLIDGDLRKPRLHTHFNLSNQVGLTSVLTKKIELEQAVLKADVDNLWILPSGPIPPNPAELLSSKSLKNLIEKAKNEFDLLLFDVPPVLSVTDAQILGHLTDGVILVVRANGVKKEQLQKAKELLEKAHVTILGTILHGVKNQENYYYGE